MAPRNYKKKGAYKSKAKRSYKPKKSLVKLIQKVIHKDVETKVCSQNLALTYFNSGINQAGEAYKAIPSIAQGVDDGMRIGDTIKGQSLNVRGHMILQLPGTNSTINCRIAVRLMVVQPKLFGNEGDANTYYSKWMPFLLQNGTTSQAFTGIIQDLYLPINTNAITKYYDKVHYLSAPIFYQNTAVGSATSDVRQTIKFFNLNIPCKKVLKYQDGTNTPLNFAPMLIMGYVHLDGSVPDTTEVNVGMAYTSLIKYEDA